MKSTSLFAVAIMLLTPVLAYGGTKDSANFQLTQSVTVAGTQLAPGQYRLTWDGSGPNVTVSFAEARKTIATAPAKLASNPTNQEAVETSTEADNTTELRAIDLRELRFNSKLRRPVRAIELSDKIGSFTRIRQFLTLRTCPRFGECLGG